MGALGPAPPGSCWAGSWLVHSPFLPDPTARMLKGFREWTPFPSKCAKKPKKKLPSPSAFRIYLLLLDHTRFLRVGFPSLHCCQPKSPPLGGPALGPQLCPLPCRQSPRAERGTGEGCDPQVQCPCFQPEAPRLSKGRWLSEATQQPHHPRFPCRTLGIKWLGSGPAQAL